MNELIQETLTFVFVWWGLMAICMILLVRETFLSARDMREHNYKCRILGLYQNGELEKLTYEELAFCVNFFKNGDSLIKPSYNVLFAIMAIFVLVAFGGLIYIW